MLNSIKFVAEKKVLDFTVFKPSAIANTLILEKVSRGDSLNHTELDHYKRVYARFNKICELAYKNDVKILVDAEESWIQDAIDEIVLKMMIKYNGNKAVVFNTSQMYRHDRLEYLRDLYKASRENNFYIGIKLVRGAYIEKENKRAKKNNYFSFFYFKWKENLM